MREGESEPIIGVPVVIGLVIVRVQPTALIVAVGVEQVRIAIGNVREIICATALRSLFNDLGAVSNSVSKIRELPSPGIFIF